MLIIEDGSKVDGANSYVDLSDFRDYAVKRGVDLPLEDSAIEPFLIQAMDYVEAQRGRFQGIRTYPKQRTQFPRIGVKIDGEDVQDDEIPELLQRAQMQAAIEAFKGVNLLPTSEGLAVIQEGVGKLGVRYSEKIGGITPTMTAVESLLQPLLRPNVGIFRAVRV
jgi:hypothetical protein